jgi:hypothetical protein
MMCPFESQMNPEPVPRGTLKTLRVHASITRACVLM